MRLIDIDELKKNIDEKIGDFPHRKMLFNVIDNQPTAYDIDKVVEQLNNSDVGTMFCGECKYAKECETIADEMLEKYELNDRVDLCAMVMRTKAIEIVKKGSAE